MESNLTLDVLEKDFMEIIIGIIAEKGSVGATADEIFNALSASIIDKYRNLAGKQHLNDDEIFKIVFGKMVQGCHIKTQAPGGVVRFVLRSGLTISM